MCGPTGLRVAANGRCEICVVPASEAASEACADMGHSFAISCYTHGRALLRRGMPAGSRTDVRGGGGCGQIRPAGAVCRGDSINHDRSRSPTVTAANQPACSSADRPLVLVDIDGVLNAFDAHAGHRPTSASPSPAATGSSSMIAIPAGSTSWPSTPTPLGHDVAGRCRPVFGRVAGLGTDWDLPRLRLAPGTPVSARRTGDGVGGYKWPMIEPLGDGDRPLVWIDDDMTDDQLRVGPGPQRRRSAHAVRPARPVGRLRRRAVRRGC